MANKKVWLGSVGPYIFDDGDTILDSGGPFDGLAQRGFITDDDIFLLGADSDPSKVIWQATPREYRVLL